MKPFWRRDLPAKFICILIAILIWIILHQVTEQGQTQGKTLEWFHK